MNFSNSLHMIFINISDIILVVSQSVGMTVVYSVNIHTKHSMKACATTVGHVRVDQGPRLQSRNSLSYIVQIDEFPNAVFGNSPKISGQNFSNGRVTVVMIIIDCFNIIFFVCWQTAQFPIYSLTSILWFSAGRRFPPLFLLYGATFLSDLTCCMLRYSQINFNLNGPL